MAHVLSWDDLPEIAGASGSRKRALAGGGAALMRVTIPAGTVAPRHAHPHEQFVQVISGAGTIETEEGPRSFGPGTLFHFPAGTWHAAEFRTETVLVETNLA